VVPIPTPPLQEAEGILFCKSCNDSSADVKFSGRNFKHHCGSAARWRCLWCGREMRADKRSTHYKKKHSVTVKKYIRTNQPSLPTSVNLRGSGESGGSTVPVDYEWDLASIFDVEEILSGEGSSTWLGSVMDETLEPKISSRTPLPSGPVVDLGVFPQTTTLIEDDYDPDPETLLRQAWPEFYDEFGNPLYTTETPSDDFASGFSQPIVEDNVDMRPKRKVPSTMSGLDLDNTDEFIHSLADELKSITLDPISRPDPNQVINYFLEACQCLASVGNQCVPEKDKVYYICPSCKSYSWVHKVVGFYKGFTCFSCLQQILNASSPPPST